MKYHNLTKHSYESVRTNPNRLDWELQPSVFKIYTNTIDEIAFDQSNSKHRFLYLIAGITAKKSYPGVEYYLRTNPSAGALYPNEIYFQARNIQGFINGIYHFNIANSCFELLYNLNDFEGLEANLGLESQYDGFIFLISSVYYRSAWKYKNRALRYCLLDAGHLLGALEASCYVYEKSMAIQYNFDKIALNEMFGFSNKEFFTCAMVSATQTNKKVSSLKMSLEYCDPCYYFEKNELIEQAYMDSIQLKSNKIEPQNIPFDFEKTKFEEVIFKRRSIRDLKAQSMRKDDFDTILQTIQLPLQQDTNEEVKVYAVINRVEQMMCGVLCDSKYLRTGNFAQKAGYLCLEQSLGSQSAVTFFLVSKGSNYQVLYQKAGIIGHRIYLASNYLGIGCSGIGAYYDDEVLEFLELDQEYMVLYALAIGN